MGGGGGHGAECANVGRLWEEKSSLELQLWARSRGGKDKEKDGGRGGRGRRSTNPFDDDYDDDDEEKSNNRDNDECDDDDFDTDENDARDMPIVGRFWHDRPSSETQRLTTRYCVVLLQLVQVLGRGESWRVAASRIGGGCRGVAAGGSRIAADGNPLARELAIDVAFDLLSLDRTDMRVRNLVPSLLLEGGYYREAYGYLKHWLRPEASLRIMDLALTMGTCAGDDDGKDEAETTTAIRRREDDVLEPPEDWMDGEMVYPSVGMVFELAYLKCRLLCSLRSASGMDGDGELLADLVGRQCADAAAAVGEEEEERELELERQVALLLSVVHRWNPHLLPNLAGPYDVDAGAIGAAPTPSSSSPDAADDDDGATSAGGNVAATSTTTIAVAATAVARAPPALSALLNAHRPGFELQYRMGNPGGGTIDEASSIWQRDVVLWHVSDPRTMAHLAEFCSDLDGNLVDVRGLDGVGGGGGAMAGSSSAATIDDRNDEGRSGGEVGGESRDDGRATAAENASKRKEAEELVAKLRREKPDRTMDQIMMHPEMAQLMIKHLHAN